MLIETDFTTGKITLSFESTKRRLSLDRAETTEFNERLREIIKEAKNGKEK